jgi:predicted amidohydrolase
MVDWAVNEYTLHSPLGVKLMVGPELALWGWPSTSTWEMHEKYAIEIPGPETERLVEKAREYGCYLSPGSVVERDPECSAHLVFNTQVLVRPSGVLYRYRKVQPWWPTETAVSPHDLLETGYDVEKYPLFPVVETEIGRLEGAKSIDGSTLSGRIMLNLDSEEDGRLTTGCAGSTDTFLRLDAPREAAVSGETAVSVVAGGGAGGHSGTNIAQGRANAIKVLGRCLREALSGVPFRLASLDGGKSRNAIPREARAVVLVDGGQVDALRAALKEAEAGVRDAFAVTDPGVTLEVNHGYAGWRPNLKSPVLATCKAVWSEIFGEEPVVTAVHAGLETALVGEKVAGLDMISIGPQIEFPHSPDERVSIPTVERFWRFLAGVLDRLSAQGRSSATVRRKRRPQDILDRTDDALARLVTAVGGQPHDLEQLVLYQDPAHGDGHGDGDPLPCLGVRESPLLGARGHHPVEDDLGRREAARPVGGPHAVGEGPRHREQVEPVAGEVVARQSREHLQRLAADVGDRTHPGLAPFEDGGKKAPLRPPEVVDEGVRHAGRLCDLTHRRAAVALRREEALGHLEYSLHVVALRRAATLCCSAFGHATSVQV